MNHQPRQVVTSRLGWLAAATAFSGCLVLAASWSGPGEPNALPVALLTLAESAPLALAWLASGWGYGSWVLRAISCDQLRSAQLGIGVATLMWIDVVLGSTGLLYVGAPWIAWLTLAPGWIGLLMQLRRAGNFRLPSATGLFATAPALAVLIIAACSAPGWLWASEFGGYDALSYHLQLPKEWLAMGRIAVLDHNVYSHLPGFTEAAYAHLAILRGDAVAASYAAQLLHAGLAIGVVVAIADHTSRRLGRHAGLLAGSLALGTPWLVVTGSLAYNEMPVCLMLITGLSVADRADLAPSTRGILVGLLAASACGSKLTAIGLVAAPLALMLLANLPRRDWVRACAAGAGIGLVVLAPWLIRNGLATGNLLFPFATDWFGLGHWTTDQATRWLDAHREHADLAARLSEFRLRFFGYGFGSNPDPTEPWKPQWLVLPWLGLLGAAGTLLFNPPQRRHCLLVVLVLSVQSLFWLAFTHLESRFLLPAVVPLSLLAASGWASIASRCAEWPLAVVCFLWSSATLWIFHSERNGAPAFAVGQLGAFTGDALGPDDQVSLGTGTLPAVALNHLLPSNARVLLVGDARPFLYRADVSYHTTWDRGPLVDVMRQFPNQPDAWASRLQELGFTHLLLDAAMLERWERSGWNDPLFTRSRVESFAMQHLQQEYAYPGDISIWRWPADNRAFRERTLPPSSGPAR